jgi:hypothetical protein
LCENRENESVTMAGAACRHGSSAYDLKRAPRRPPTRIWCTDAPAVRSCIHDCDEKRNGN